MMMVASRAMVVVVLVLSASVGWWLSSLGHCIDTSLRRYEDAARVIAEAALSLVSTLIGGQDKAPQLRMKCMRGSNEDRDRLNADKGSWSG